MNAYQVEDVVEESRLEYEIDPAMVEVAMDKFRSGQTFVAAVLEGLATAIVGAVIWAVITSVTAD